MSRSFTDIPSADVVRMIGESPLCWIVPHADPAAAILMPVILECDAAGAAEALLGHLPRVCPANRALGRDPLATFLMLGPNAYVSPAAAGTSDWAPTWNFVSAKITGPVALDEALTRPSVEAMVARMEGPDGWRAEALGARYERLLSRIVGFRAAIDELVPRFKLGQDESDEVFTAIASAFADTPLGDWMARLADR